MLTSLHYQPPTTNNSRVEWRGERRGESLSSNVFMRRSEGEGTRRVSCEAGLVFDKLYLISHVSLWGKYKHCECNAVSPRPTQSKDIFTIVPDVMLDDWHLKCIILQDRNLHDDTVTHCQPDAGWPVLCAPSQHWEFYILGNSVKSAGMGGYSYKKSERAFS